MKSKKAILLMWTLALAPVILVLFCLSTLPQRIPMHWGIDGTIRYGGKWELVGLTLLSPLLAFLYQFLPRIDPRKHNYSKFQRHYDRLAPLISLFFLLMVSLTLLESYCPGSVTVYKAVGVLVGSLFLVIGNLMGKIKSNFFMGIRSPWSLEDPDIWNKTQRLGGKCFFLSGLIAVAGALLLSEKIYAAVFFLSAIPCVLLPCFMSWRWYRCKKTQDRPSS